MRREGGKERDCRREEVKRQDERERERNIRAYTVQPMCIEHGNNPGEIQQRSRVTLLFDLMNIHDQAERDGGSLVHGSVSTCCCSSDEELLQRKEG